MARPSVVRLGASIAVGALAAAVLSAPGAHAEQGARTTDRSAPVCVSKSLPASLGPGKANRYRVAATLCRPASAPTARNLPVQLLVPGYTIDRRYWDPSVGDGRYSWVRRATAAGYATLAIDRLGAGGSSRPPSAAVSVPLHAWTIHQLVTAVNAGSITGAKPPKTLVVGHSMGAAATQVWASTYGRGGTGVNAVVLLSWLHTPLWLGTPGVILTSAPARLEKRFAHEPAGYLASVPGAHKRLFFRGANADPAAISYDERAKTLGTLTEEVTIVPTILPTVTRAIRVPVFLGTGEHDAIFCGPVTPCRDPKTVAARERLNFTAPLTTYVLKDAGHNVNLHRNAPALFDAAQTWIGKR